ncbi:hypothetical protein VNI00_000524 [Paramarasmius palmivorus]|uniref:Small secreted protein n=1 Tax=Paramarasmius palmivorus TaxID=297713 RepID=A0AAW0EB22_9AGAR
MARFTFAALFFTSAFTATVYGAPVPSSKAIAARQVQFQELPYEQFQISNGVAGNAAAEANAVFVDPFQGITDLASIPSDVLTAVKNMRSAAEDAETSLFNPAIDAASGAAADALQVGKIKNKVLKLTGLAMARKIQLAKDQAAGKDTSSLEEALADTETKLAKNIETDVASAGQASQSVVSGGGASNNNANAGSANTGASANTSTNTGATGNASNTGAATGASTGGAAVQFAELPYAQFQISDGVAGNAAAEANAVFVDPFQGVDLSTVSKETLQAVKSMREAAEDAETSLFNPAIDGASGDEADALQVGKIKNKVLKLTGFVQALKIEIAQLQAAGEDSSEREAKLAQEQTKLTKNIDTDVKSAGAASLSVA